MGEVFVLGFDGLELPHWLRDFAERFGLGGVLLFDEQARGGGVRNIESRQQLRGLCRQIAALPSAPLVLIDQEGGQVCRLKEQRGFAPLPSAEEMAELSPTKQQVLLDSSYAEMADLGIQVNLAPVVDCNLDPQAPEVGARGRSYSKYPAAVHGYALRHAKAARKVGIGLCIKHYPGLGSAQFNTHLEACILEDIPSEPLQLFAELAPQIPMHGVLMSHVCAPQWGHLPTSLNPQAAAALLRQAPQAWLFTDDLQMQALQQYCSTEQACQLALIAGCQLLLLGNNLLQQQEQCVHYVQSLLKAAQQQPLLAKNLQQAISDNTQRKAFN